MDLTFVIEFFHGFLWFCMCFWVDLGEEYEEEEFFYGFWVRVMGYVGIEILGEFAGGNEKIGLRNGWRVLFFKLSCHVGPFFSTF